MKIDELPQVESHNLHTLEIPGEFEGFVYKWTNLDNLKEYETTGIPVKIYYLGSRGSEKEQVTIGDGSYWQSSMNEEFIEPFQDSNSNWKYEILGIYPTYDNTLETEIRMLRDVDAKNNELYYNDSNGIPKDKVMVDRLKTDPEDADKLRKRIQSTIDNYRTKIDHPTKYEPNNNDFPIVDVALSVHEEMNGSTGNEVSRKKKKARVQIRIKDKSSNQRNIANKIDEKGGNLDLCNPIVVFHDIWYEGILWKELRIDGSTTVLGILSSKQHFPSKKVATIVIPESVHENKFTDAQIEEIAGLLNPISEIVKDPFTATDGRKYIVKCYFRDGRKVEDDLNVTYLKKHNLTTKQIGGIKRRAIKEIKLLNEYKAIEDAGKTRVDGRSKQYQDRWERENKEKEKNHPHVRAIYGYAGEQKMADIIRDQIDQMVGTNKTDLEIGMWFKGKDQKKEWKKTWEQHHKLGGQRYAIGLQVEKEIYGNDDCEDIVVNFHHYALSE